MKLMNMLILFDEILLTLENIPDNHDKFSVS